MAKPNFEFDMVDDNRFVDHVETKLLSPVKETFTPSKRFLHDVNQSKQPDTDLGKKNIASLEKEAKSGLDDAINNVTEHFVERQESIIEAGVPDVIESPNKMVDVAFSFINDEADSLDAVNNNSELSMQCSDTEVNNTADDVNANYETDSNQYLGKEVILHEKDSRSQEQAKDVESRKEDEAHMTLYWYKTNMDVDLEELEAFKKSQNENRETSTIKGSFQSGYYKDNLYDSERLVAQDSKMITTEKKSKEGDTWYPAFESVSSHCLDVTSSLKSEPKTKKNIENTSIKETGSNPPWGLEREDKVIEISEATDDLPSVLSELSVYVKTPLAKSFELDNSDATGYMESTDKDMIQKKIFKTEMQMNTKHNAKTLDKKDVSNEKSKPFETVKAGAKYLDLDESDAVGYMELKDKDDIKEKHDEKIDAVDNDQTDAVGYMEIGDKPVEEMFSSTDSKVAYAAIIDSSLTIETTEKYAQNISNQIVTSVTKRLDKDAEFKTDTEDIPDGSKEVVDEVIKSSIERITKTRPQADEMEHGEPVEVKRKFKLSTDTEDQIKKMGGTLVETQVFVDEYLDNSSYSILLHDCWLRLRNKQFQMKLGSKVQGKSMSYPETAAEAEIKEALNRIISKKYKGKVSTSDKPLDVLIDEFGLTEFVTIETTRKTYQLSEYVIDLDLTSLGPEAGDIGVLINMPSQIVEHLKQMDHIAKQIGMKPLHQSA